MTLREQLLDLNDPRHRESASALIPGAGNVPGIRIPTRRSMALQIARRILRRPSKRRVEK